MTGIYIYNSIALGGFQESSSDIDFMTICNSQFEMKDLQYLEQLHRFIAISFPRVNRLDGMYLRFTDIGKLNKEIDKYPYCNNGKFMKNGYYDNNHVSCWTLYNHGIKLQGLYVSDLNISVTWNNIIKTMDYNLNNYWQKKLQTPDLFAQDYWIEFIILTLSRIIYTLEKNKITTKTIAANYMNYKYPDWKLLVRPYSKRC